MSRNHWALRLSVGAIFWITASIHHDLVMDVENSVVGMFAYHASAALCDFLLLILSANVLVGRLSDDMQALFLAFMCLNFLGFLAYAAYISPVFYDMACLGLSYAQYLRIFMDDQYDALAHLLGNKLVRRPDINCKKLHVKKAQ